MEKVRLGRQQDGKKRWRAWAAATASFGEKREIRWGRKKRAAVPAISRGGCWRSKKPGSCVVRRANGALTALGPARVARSREGERERDKQVAPGWSHPNFKTGLKLSYENPPKKHILAFWKFPKNLCQHFKLFYTFFVIATLWIKIVSKFKNPIFKLFSKYKTFILGT